MGAETNEVRGRDWEERTEGKLWPGCKISILNAHLKNSKASDQQEPSF